MKDSKPSRTGRGSSSGDLTRRGFLARATAATVGLGGLVAPLRARIAHAAGADGFGSLGAPDRHGLRLPRGFTSRVVATSGVEVGSSGYVWHAAPDGGATFATQSGGWIYVSNAELEDGAGGVGALRFSATGLIEDAYSILSGTTRNCAGGATPWQTWLSCEEFEGGHVWECDPMTPGSQGVVRPALGAFCHEAAAVDPAHQHVYLTEDQPDGLLYRFSPARYPDLSAGKLEAAEILDPGGAGPIRPGEVRTLVWHVVPDPSAATIFTRRQVPRATAFDGGEGCAYRDGLVYFSTKGDDRVWLFDTRSSQISILYDAGSTHGSALSNVDNVFAASSGDVYVAEDPGDLRIVALTPGGSVRPIVQLTGQRGTEITGPALSPDGTRLYFSSQRNPGTTYEVEGPFVTSVVSSAVPSEPDRVGGLVGLAGAAIVGGLVWTATRRRGRAHDTVDPSS